MELRQLETFARVASLHSFTRAAEELSLTQPAVTRQIAALERELRTRLLDRLGRRVELTVAGEALYLRAREILRLAEEAGEVVAEVTSGATGRLTIGASSTAATYLLPTVLRGYRERSPGIELSVRTGVSARVAEMVTANEVDLGVVMGLRTTQGLAVIPLADYSLVAVVYPGHPLAEGRQAGQEGCVSLEALAQSSLILMQEGTNLRAYAARMLLTAGVEAHPRMEMDNVEAIKKMIEARLGVSLLPLLAVNAEVAAGRLVALPLPEQPDSRRQLSAIHREGKHLSTPVRALLDLLVQHPVPRL
ncbi:MAG TPA: LysR family transcriptional regulator [Armatimonadota bacterium]|jgi:DNA-binding transcriptional LysR family regulator